MIIQVCQCVLLLIITWADQTLLMLAFECLVRLHCLVVVGRGYINSCSLVVELRVVISTLYFVNNVSVCVACFVLSQVPKTMQYVTRSTQPGHPSVSE